jgi:galactose mutarotase-like enzyme
MLGWSLRHRGRELLGHPVSVGVYKTTGEPTAIALLHPWANRLASAGYEIGGRRVRLDTSAPNVHTDPNGLPIHGLVAGSPHWEVVDEQPARVRARLDYSAWPELAGGFPFPHEIRLTAELRDDRLELDTVLAPTGDQPVPVAFGFHPYLRLPGLDRKRWVVELPVTSRMVLDERKLPTGVSEPVRFRPAPLGDRTFDDAFDGLGDPTEFAISGAGRRLSVLFIQGYHFAQVYAPPGADFISFEPMTAPLDPFNSPHTRLVLPGSSYRAWYAIVVEETASS